MTQVAEEKVWQALSRVIEPDFKKDLVTLKMIENLKIEEGKVSFTIVLTTPACPLKDEMKNACNDALSSVPGVTSTEIAFTARTTSGTFAGKAPITGVRNVLAVSSGKGGVGKSTTSVNLAIGLQAMGAKVGILDADVYGPNIPMMLGINTQPKQVENRFIPPSANGIACMSMAFLVPPGTPLIWRGPMLHGVIQQFVRDVEWGELDYLVVDMPPGTGDAQLSLAQLVPLSGAVIVTTPQEVSLSDSRRGLAMFQKVNVPILGIIENMSMFVCPNCQHETPIFSQGGGEMAAKELKVPFLGRIPIDLSIREGGDSGVPIGIAQPQSPISKSYENIAGQIASAISILNAGAKPIQIANFG
ncbi:MAG: Mrp/NBP35 family ATP-binding protein [Nitrospirae bacterium]|jgi:ATP-binding protein involved in chromosome partitioning|nr:Mrp/NBP35 family ATP-binding protein [Nitrospirota bacterium]